MTIPEAEVDPYEEWSEWREWYVNEVGDAYLICLRSKCDWMSDNVPILMDRDLALKMFAAHYTEAHADE